MSDAVFFLLPDEQSTRRLGHLLADRLGPGDVLALIGDLGTGKTCLTQAIAHGLGVPDDEVSSPTFTLIHEYVGRLRLRHCDTYRLRRAEEFPDLGLDELFAEDGVAIVEWADRVRDDLPRDRLELTIEAVGPQARRVTAEGTGARGVELAEALGASAAEWRTAGRS